jgi:iron complex transport system permease protein
MIMQSILAVRERGNVVIITAMSVLLVAVTLFSLTVGAVSIPVQDVAVVVLKKVGLFSNTTVDEMHTIVLTSIRLPRILMTLLIGAALGISGSALQGLFRNPLVEPSLIGVSGGSAVAVVLLIVFGGSLALPKGGALFNSILPIAAFSGGLIATFLVLKLSSQQGSTNIAVLILIGVALNALAGAVIGLAIFYADENQLRTFTFWTLGDLGGAEWEKLKVGAPLLLLSSVGLLFFSKPLNALAIGEAEAFHMGVDVERTKLVIILLSALGVGVSVSLSGMISFIGLIVPHVIRVLFHADHRLVLPASVLGGALLLILSDLIARTIVSPAELPIGVVTALIGAPFFIALLINAKKKQEI